MLELVSWNYWNVWTKPQPSVSGYQSLPQFDDGLDPSESFFHGAFELLFESHSTYFEELSNKYFMQALPFSEKRPVYLSQNKTQL